MANEQLDLIDVTPEHSKEIIACAKRYKAAQSKKTAAAEDEKYERTALLELIEKENLERLDDGVIKFSIDGFVITIEPREDAVKVKETNVE